MSERETESERGRERGGERVRERGSERDGGRETERDGETESQWRQRERERESSHGVSAGTFIVISRMRCTDVDTERIPIGPQQESLDIGCIIAMKASAYSPLQFGRYENIFCSSCSSFMLVLS